MDNSRLIKKYSESSVIQAPNLDKMLRQVNLFGYLKSNDLYTGFHSNSLIELSFTLIEHTNAIVLKYNSHFWHLDIQGIQITRVQFTILKQAGVVYNHIN